MSNFKGANISGIHNANVGDNNTINYSSMNTIDWSMLEKEISNIMHNQKIESDQKDIFEDMMKYVNKKDEKGIKAYIKRNKESFNLNFLAGVLSSTFVQFITSNILK